MQWFDSVITTYKIRDLAQVRLLSDPLKLQLLQAFSERPKTTKQVAAELNESVTKLYRHVDALHDAGLLEIAEEKRKRGTVERTFQAVAQRFEADPSLFAGDAGDDMVDAIRDLLREGEDEILRSIASPENKRGQMPTVVRLRCKASPARIAALRRSLNDWIDSAQEDEASESEVAEEVGALIAFYPVGREP